MDKEKADMIICTIFNKKCKEVRQKIRSMRANKLKDIIAKLNRILVGYYHYYGITDNGR